MTKRDEPALKVSHDSPESHERQSVTRPISSVRAQDELPSEEQRSERDVPSSTEDSSRDRPTLMGLAPVDPEDEADYASGSHIPHERTSGEPETSTVQPASWLAADAEQAEAHDAHRVHGVHADAEQDDADDAEADADDDDEADEAYEDEDDEEDSDDDEADEDDDLDDEADEDDDPDVEAGQEQEAAPELTAETQAQHIALASSEGSAPAADEHAAVAAADAQPRAPMHIGMFMPAHGDQHARLPEEGESEWLDLSTRWLVTSGPRSVPVPVTEQPIVDDNEITDAYWAERLSARVAPRADTQSSAPPPPPQSPPAGTQLHGRRRAASRPTIAYDLPTGAAGYEPQAASFDAAGAGQRQWAPAPRRHDTLAGISPLPEDPSQWPPQTANDGARSSRPHAEPNPWREEPSYSDAPRAQSHGAHAHRPSTMAASYAAPAGTIPPWAAPMPQYAMQPPAAMVPPYAPNAWNGGVTLPPPWAAQPNYGMHMQPPAAYASSERRATRTMDYALPPVPSQATASRAAMRAPQTPANEISFEQWKGMANTWFMTVGKLALAGMALHFSGLAKPLLANFGYAPAQAASVEPAVRTPAPVAASVAAASIIPEGLSPESAEEPAPRRTPAAAKREPNVTSETTEAPARRYSYKSAHKAKPKPHAKRSAAAEAPAAAPQPVAATQPAAPAAPTPQAAPLAAAAPAAPAAEETVGEALLRINSRPWSEIYVDGTHVGHTPKLDLRVSAGSHSIRLVNRDLNLTKTFEVDLAAGETVSHVELFID